jgi:hypothetical protein
MHVKVASFEMSYTLIVQIFCRGLDDEIKNSIKEGLSLRLNDEVVVLTPGNGKCDMTANEEYIIFKFRETQIIKFFLQLAETPFDTFSAGITLELTSRALNDKLRYKFNLH